MNAVFIWIPKNAGSTICATLRVKLFVKLDSIEAGFANNGIVTFGHIDYFELIKEEYVAKEFDETAFKFAFSRNPYDRAISLYCYLKRSYYKKDKTFLSFCRNLKENGCEPIGLYNVRKSSQCNPQVRWIENVDVDFIGKVESIQKDMKVLFDRLGVPQIQIPHKNSSSHNDYRQYYCSESKEIINKFYKEDFEYFKYHENIIL